MATLTARSSSASVVRNVSNTLYMEEARRLLSAATSLSFSWDGATYSGMSVNVGMVVDCHTGIGAYIRPLVTSVESGLKTNARVPLGPRGWSGFFSISYR